MKDNTSTKMGIYKWINLSNNKIYIGSALNFKSRKSAHLRELRRKVHHSEHLQSAFNMYGENQFVFIVLEEITDRNLLKEREQYYLDLYKSYDPSVGYNMAHYADRPGIGLVPWNKDSWKKRVSEEQIISDYLSGLSTADLSSKYHINLVIIGKVLNAAGVMRSISEAGRIYREKNPTVKTYDKKKADKEYYDVHRDIIVQRAIDWNKAHKDIVRARAKKQYEHTKKLIGTKND
jgi:group I intron endonuclease